MLRYDVFGFPGAGKSTLCDPIWGPHELPIEDRLPPKSWQPFVDEVSRLFHVIREHPTLEAAIRMNNRSFRKMATVARAEREPFRPGYIQTGFIQRGLGFGWRMTELGIDPRDELVDFFRLMPPPAGAVFMLCPIDIAISRNVDRGKVRETAHEVRDHIVRAMPQSIEVALGVIRDRGIPILEVSTVQNVSKARQELEDFASQISTIDTAVGRNCEVAVCKEPYWWSA